MQVRGSRLQRRDEVQAVRTEGKEPARGARASLSEGLYQFNYGIGSYDHQPKGRGLAVLRSGAVLGSDEWGGVFSGHYRLATDDALHHVSVSLRLPPFAELVTGHRAGAQTVEVKLECRFETPDPRAVAVVEVEGVPVVVELVYIGAIPTT